MLKDPIIKDNILKDYIEDGRKAATWKRKRKGGKALTPFRSTRVATRKRKRKGGKVIAGSGHLRASMMRGKSKRKRKGGKGPDDPFAPDNHAFSI